jgi:UDPglucose 6-dehydrogenase
MKVCVHGLWHLGSVTAACLASVGHEVIGLDADSVVIKNLAQGKAPLYEPGLDALLGLGISQGRLEFASSVIDSVKSAEVLWVTFDTPVDDDDNADVNFVLNEIKTLLPQLSTNTTVLVSSQMPVGSIGLLEEFAKDNLPHKCLQFACSPENLRLGKACDVFSKPDRIIVGVRTDEARVILEKLLTPITDRIEWMSVESAEMTKHAINAFLATSVTFANEMAAICELVGADAKEVERGLKTEMRIGPKAYLSPGGPFAGGTLARDIEYLGITSGSRGLITPLLSSVRRSNDEHKNWVRRKLLSEFGTLAGVHIAILGLTYKPGTDTLRRSLSVELCDWLIEQGAKISVFDPAVQGLPERWKNQVIRASSAIAAVIGADALVVGTEWPEFRQEAINIAEKLKPDTVVIDPNRHLSFGEHLFDLRYLAVGTSIEK